MTNKEKNNLEGLSLNLIKFLKKKQLKIKSTIIMDKNRYRADLFRSEDFANLLKEKENFEELQKILLKFEIPEDSMNTTTKILNFLLNSKLVIKLERFHDVTDTKKYKFPKKMEIHSVE